MHFLTCYKSANTVRVTIPKRLRAELECQPGDVLRVETTRIGSAKLTNVSAFDRRKKRKKAKS